MNNCCSTNHSLIVRTLANEKVNPNIPNRFGSCLISQCHEYLEQGLGTKLIQIGIILNIEKIFKIRFPKWTHIPNLELWNTSYGQCCNVALLPIMRFKKDPLVLVLKFFIKQKIIGVSSFNLSKNQNLSILNPSQIFVSLVLSFNYSYFDKTHI